MWQHLDHGRTEDWAQPGHQNLQGDLFTLSITSRALSRLKQVPGLVLAGLCGSERREFGRIFWTPGLRHPGEEAEEFRDWLRTNLVGSAEVPPPC